ncbi:hypothetical protein E2C01_037417 [Portunus trituberculatus]|uniref:Uncharacterized protein n=1 Tax=Portunus trituberculatus TaxID=210409 RepID=A0A5B7FE32_PORTR|nr:hypothetical protein [Portunus trituberculatus]
MYAFCPPTLSTCKNPIDSLSLADQRSTSETGHPRASLGRAASPFSVLEEMKTSLGCLHAALALVLVLALLQPAGQWETLLAFI